MITPYGLHNSPNQRTRHRSGPMGLVLLSLVMLAAMPAPGAEGKQGPYPDGVLESWEAQYREPAKDIKARPGAPNSKVLDRHCRILPGEIRPAEVVIRRTGALLAHIRGLAGAPDLKNYDQTLRALRKQYSDGKRTENASDKALYLDACKLRREVALANPLLDFDAMIFVTKGGNREGVLQCWDYGYGVSRRGGLYKVTGLKSGRPKVHDILANSVVGSGRLKGRKLGGRGAFNVPALGYDGKTIVFSFVEKAGIREPWPRDVFHAFTRQSCFHLYKVNTDGSGLVQLTDGRRNDYHPCNLPSGRIVFVSDRRNIMDRCQGGSPYREFSQPCGTMHSIKGDGSDLICISYHETTELFPSVDNNGMLVYTRWDYVDRDFSAAHNFWICYPDGRDPRAPHANYPYPHHTFEGKWKDGRADRPWAEYAIRGIPGSRKYVAVAGKHHISTPRGVLILIDLSVEDDNKMSQVTRFHDYALPDEASGYHGDMDKGLPACIGYTDPWPLSEDYMIAAQGNTVWLLDRFGNREVLFSVSRADCNGISSVRCPIPMKPRKAPPVIPTMTYQGERYKKPGHKRATISVMNVYESDFDWPAKTKIKAIRVVQLFPYPWHSPFQDQPQIGPGAGVSARAVLGTVPVEADGSAYFEAPVEKAIYFQALDENGMAVQSMRSCTYVHPGEHMSCLGCHEKKQTIRQPKKRPLALRRPPSRLVPDLKDGSCPLTYARLVKPVLEGKCLPCHRKNKKPAPNLSKYRFYFHGTGGHSGVGRIHGGYRTIAGRFGALHTGIAKVLLRKHHRAALSMKEINRITLWVDANSNELGAYYDEGKQRAGEVVWPLIDMDPANPAGVDLLPGGLRPPTPNASTPLMIKSEEMIKLRWPERK